MIRKSTTLQPRHKPAPSWFWMLLVCFFMVAAGCTDSSQNHGTDPPPENQTQAASQDRPHKKKVLFVNSYHWGYDWSDRITQGVCDTFGAVLNQAGQIDNSNSKVNLDIVYMDTKRNKSETFKKQAALKVKKKIEQWRPDLVITADDNAAKYLLVPHYKNHSLPFVFCGINQDASKYGLPFSNATGMVEVFLLPQAKDIIQPYTKGQTICAIGSNTISEHKNIEFSQEKYGVDLTAFYADTYAQLKKAFQTCQRDCDLLFLFEFFSVKGFDPDDFSDFVYQTAKIPSATLYGFAKDYVLAACTIVAKELGEYAAQTALEILDGRSPADIPIVFNKKAEIFLNMKLAKKLGITFPMGLVESAELLSCEKKLLFINSYHKGYKWSDDIEKGLLKSLNITVNPDGTLNTDKSDVLVKIIRMDTKLNAGEAFKQQAALKAKAVIDQWQPDILIASDDNASKYLIDPHIKNTRLPVVFCGVNWDASVYGFPADNITGMVEISPYQETIKLMSQFARGERIGLIGADSFSNQREVKYLKHLLSPLPLQAVLVPDFESWKTQYQKFQQNVDMLIQISNTGIKNWDPQVAQTFIFNHTKIITGAISDDQTAAYCLMGMTKIGEEQGWWAGNTALKILDGTPPSAIPVTRNTQVKIYLNMELAKAMGLHFPMDLVEKSTFVGE